MNIRCVPVELHLKRQFAVAGGKASVRRNMICILNDIGLGEAAGSVHYGATEDQLYEEVRLAVNEAEQIEEQSFPSFLETLEERFSPPVLCALSTAWHDYRAKSARSSLAEEMGLGMLLPLRSSYTVSVGDSSAIRELVDEGFICLKVKLGNEKKDWQPAVDLMRACGERCRFRIDANGSWDVDTASKICSNLDPNTVELIEQPFPPQQREWWSKLREEIEIPLIMDESITGPEDVEAASSFIDGINVKIQKSGRLERAVETLEKAREAGLLTMIGCMIESSVGIAAACQLTSLADYIDLDGRLLVESDPFTGLTYANSIPELRSDYGHGVTYA